MNNQNRTPLDETTHYVSISDIISEGSYLLYEMRDVEVVSTTLDPNLGKINYSKLVHPLASPGVMNASFNQELLSLLFEETPFYYLAPVIERDVTTPILPITRDIGVVGVPSPLQTSFWEVWHREIQGFFVNNLLLDIFNKLKYPYIDECQYMNAKLFPELALKAFSTEDPDGQLLEFRTTSQENNDDIAKGDIGCLDYLDNIVQQKLNSTYAIIDYKPDQADLLSAWSESMYLSGKLSFEDLQKEQTVYRLQDVSYELLRRKFAGSFTLYNLALASVDKRGSFVRTVAIGDVYTSSINKSFRDTRFARVLDIPGVLTKTEKITNLHPFEYFYENVADSEKEILPIDIVTPLYYTSATQSFGSTEAESYNAEAFYMTGKSSDVRDYRAEHLRGNSTSLNWDVPSSPFSSEAFKDIYNTLDTYVLDPNTQAGRIYRKLDDVVEIEKPDGSKEIIKNKLDIHAPSISSSVTTGNVLDVNADIILYHRNSLQASLSDSYPYATYSIASNNSLSLMDIPWMHYLKTSTENKSRVQDNITFGTQISKYEQIPDEQKATTMFFAISYGDDSLAQETLSINTSATHGLPIRSYQEYVDDFEVYPKYAYLWLITINSNIDSFKVEESTTSSNSVDIKATLFSKITLRIDVNKNALNPYKDLFTETVVTHDNISETVLVSQFDQVDEFEKLKQNHRGLLPFSYKDVVDSKIVSLKYGVYKEDSKDYFLDDIDDMGYSKSLFVFSSSDLTNYSNSHRNPREAVRNTPDLLASPTSAVKSVYFIVERQQMDQGKLTTTFYWSEPIRVLNLSKEQSILNGGFTLKPDWYHLCFHLNPELNFNSNTPSALRGKQAYKAPLDSKETVIGPSSVTALSNLARVHHMDFLCNDSGSEKAPWVDDSNEAAAAFDGFYLYHFHQLPSSSITPQKTPVVVDVFGDNRQLDYYDGAPGEKPNRSDIYISPITYRHGLRFADSSLESTGENPNLNYFELLPKHPKYLQGYNWTKWWWNQASSGKTFLFNLDLDIAPVRNLLEKKLADKQAAYEKDPSVVNTFQDIQEKVTYTLVYVKDNFRFKIDCFATKTLLDRGNAKEQSSVESLYSPTSYFFTVSLEILKANQSTVCTSRKFFFQPYSNFSPNIRVGADIIYNDDNSKNSLLAIVVNDEIFLKECMFELKDTFKAQTGLIMFSEIDLENVSSQRNSFKGVLYDFRAYNEGLSKENLIITNKGSNREQFLLSSSLIRLGYNMYRDLGILKKVSRFKNRDVENAEALPEVTSIRVFNRPNWNSILLDLFPNSKEEYSVQSPLYAEDIIDPKSDEDIFKRNEFGNYYLNDAIQQDLVENVEVINNINPGMKTSYEQSISYGGVSMPLSKNDLVTIVMSSLYPVTYRNVAFTSSAKLQVGSNGQIETVPQYPIDIPVSAIGGSLKYQADLNMNFTMDTTSDFSIWYSRGFNVTRLHSKALDTSIVSLVDRNLRGADNNHVLIPITIPEQENVLTATTGTLDRFYLKGVVLSSSINSLLKATSYYNELRIPIAQANYAGDGELSYASKWDAIRLLKEGAYYITYKYPFQLLPFTDEEYDRSNSLSYATQYATCRFKIVVTGVPVEYNSSKWAVKGHPKEYSKAGLAATLESPSGLVVPENNKNFPHREVLIDMYVMNKSSIAGVDNIDCSDFRWELLASNHTTDKDVIELSPATLAEGLPLLKEIPLFFSRDYTSPFFVATPTLDGYDATKTSSNLNQPIDVRVLYNSENLKAENLAVTTLDDLDKLVIVSGKSYKLLFDFDAKLAEFSYSDDEASTASTKAITEAELQTYSRMYNLLDQTAPVSHTYMYTRLINWGARELSNITATTSGYSTLNGAWKEKNTTYEDEFYFGNPYSKSSANNYLLDIGLSRFPVNQSAAFPYTATEVLPGSFISSDLLLKLDALDRGKDMKGGVTLCADVAFNEAATLKKQYSALKAAITSSISEMTTCANGIFSQLSKIKPNLHYMQGDTDADDKMLKFTKVRTLAGGLFAYHASYRSIPYRNGNLQISTRSLFRNNLFISQDFSDKSTWLCSSHGTFVPESQYDIATGGKDVFEVSVLPGEPFTMEYITSDTSYNKVYEVALVVKAPNVKVTALFHQDNSTEEYPMQATEVAQNSTSTYRVFSVNTQTPVKATSIGFRIETTSKLTTPTTVRFTKAIARVSDTITHKLGLYDALFTNDPTKTSLLTMQHNIVAFKKKDSVEYLPIQFENRISTRGINGTSMKVTYVDNPAVQEFISANSLGFLPGNPKVESLIQPWIRRLQFWESYNTGEELLAEREKQGAPRTVLRRYRVGTNEQGVKKAKLASGVSHDIYTEADLQYDGTSNIKIKSLKLNLVNGDPNQPLALSSYNTNLKLSNSNKKGQDLPLTISNERFSAITNCFNPARYKQGSSSKVAITNIQLLGKTKDKQDEVLYEIEYLPLIYDEMEQHISYNIFFHRSRT